MLKIIPYWELKGIISWDGTSKQQDIVDSGIYIVYIEVLKQGVCVYSKVYLFCYLDFFQKQNVNSFYIRFNLNTLNSGINFVNYKGFINI